MPRSEKENNKFFFSIFLYLGFHCVIIINKKLDYKFCTSCLVLYSQFWLNLPMDDCHFFGVWTNGPLTLQKQILRKTLPVWNHLPKTHLPRVHLEGVFLSNW